LLHQVGFFHLLLYDAQNHETETYIIFNNFFLRIVPHLQDNVEIYGTAGQSTVDNKTQHRKEMICMPHN